MPKSLGLGGIEIKTRWREECSHGQDIALLNSLATCPVLFLDDIGQARPSEAYGRWLHQIIDRRLGANLPWFITTNLTGQGVCDMFDRSMMSRLSASRIWEFKGKDMRGELMSTNEVSV